MSKQAEIDRLNARIAELEQDNAMLAALAQAQPAEGAWPTFGLEAIVGDVGTITGPPIMGTDDHNNAGPAQFPPGVDYDEGMAALADEMEPHPFRAMPGNSYCGVCGATLGVGQHRVAPVG